MKIKGQDKIVKELSTFTIDTLPHTILLSGEEGSGRHTICKSLSELFSLPMEELDKDKITFEYLCEVQSRAYLSMYLIDLSIVDERIQNVILKFIEEPSIYSYIILLCENTNTVLPTIIGRCNTYTLERYPKELLREFSDDDLVVEYCTTPGQIIKYSDKIIDIIKLCKNIDTNISSAAIGNLFAITAKVPKIYPADIFIKILLNVVKDKESYERVLEAQKDLRFAVDKTWYLEKFLIELKFIKKKYDNRRT